MERRSILNIVIVVLTAIGLGVLSNSAISQQKSLKEQLVGAWSIVSSTGPDGTPRKNRKGLFIMTDSGHFSWQVFRSDRPHLASNNRLNATADELKALNQGMLAYFGTYSVDETDKVVTFLTQASTFPNSEGETIKRIITKVTADELTYINPANVDGVRVETVWRRAK
jgi:hypothetical protein